MDITDQGGAKLNLTPMSESASISGRPNIAVMESNVFAD